MDPIFENTIDTILAYWHPCFIVGPADSEPPLLRLGVRAEAEGPPPAVEPLF